MRTWAEINLSAVRHNLRAIKAQVGPGVAVMGVVKADAYGHGAAQLSSVLSEEGIARFAVAELGEALELRAAGVRQSIQILTPLLPEERDAALEAGFILSVSCMSEILGIQRAARHKGLNASVHLITDTGMGRMGAPVADVPRILRRMRRLKHLKVEGLFTHFSSADEDDPTYTRSQLAQFDNLVTNLREKRLCPPLVHAANSAAMALYPQANYSMVRPGIALWGVTSSSSICDVLGLKPVLSLHTRVALIKKIAKGSAVGYGRRFIAPRDLRVALLPCGYADGFRRALSGNGEVIIRGSYAPVLGVVSMDLMSVDITHIDNVQPYDKVTLIGKQEEAEITCESVARRIGTIPYEISCGLGKRVKRIYTNAKNAVQYRKAQ